MIEDRLHAGRGPDLPTQSAYARCDRLETRALSGRLVNQRHLDASAQLRALERFRQFAHGLDHLRVHAFTRLGLDETDGPSFCRNQEIHLKALLISKVI